MSKQTLLPITIRTAQLTDAPTLHPLINTSYRSSAGWTNEHTLVKDERITLSSLRTELSQPASKSHILVATPRPTTPPTIPPTIYGCIQISTTSREGEADIGLFAVDPALQSQGVGRRLLEAACDYAKNTMRAKVALLHVISVREELLAWYRRFGFVETGEKEGFVWPELALIENMQFAILRKELV
ncbi:hypothetical protein HDV00_010632 [Rhizophlyctis rosea]|nr:hypothetical protein HDV00_010632 [Rhizophlyctis rosea]